MSSRYAIPITYLVQKYDKNSVYPYDYNVQWIRVYRYLEKLYLIMSIWIEKWRNLFFTYKWLTLLYFLQWEQWIVQVKKV